MGDMLLEKLNVALIKIIQTKLFNQLNVHY